VRGGSDGKAGFYLRYKRLSLSNNGNFAVRRPDDIFRGLGVDVIRKDRVSFNLGLRFDRGRRASDVPELGGYDDIASTVRLRASATYHPDSLWSMSASWSGDVLGKGGGQVVDFALSRDESLEPRVHWALGLGVSMADQRFHQGRFGVTPLQSSVSGLPVYRPGAGLLNASIGTTLRLDISPSWVGFVGCSAAHVLGPQLHSPLIKDSTNWGVSAGIARRF
jgi:outer membrane scaffolding protein for murein synthesis (MipA/OmpV family)